MYCHWCWIVSTSKLSELKWQEFIISHVPVGQLGVQLIWPGLGWLVLGLLMCLSGLLTGCLVLDGPDGPSGTGLLSSMHLSPLQKPMTPPLSGPYLSQVFPNPIGQSRSHGQVWHWCGKAHQIFISGTNCYQLSSSKTTQFLYLGISVGQKFAHVLNRVLS